MLERIESEKNEKGHMNNNPKVSGLMLKLSDYMAHACRHPLPPEVAIRAKLHLVDTFAAMISGTRLLPGKKGISYVKSLGGRKEAGVIGTRLVTSTLNAAMANGMCAHADETDDTHPPSITHPGCSVIPAALAIAERDKLPGSHVLRAIVLGYDICARLALALKPMPFMRSGHHTCAFGQVFGAAATAGSLLNLNALQTRYLLSYTAEKASGLYTMFRDEDHIEKSYAMGGMPAQNGLAAALMIKHGFTGVEDVFSGQRDFFYTFSPDGEKQELVRGLGKDYEILRAAIKFWPVGGPVQGPVDVLNRMIREHSLIAETIQKISVRIPEQELETVNNREMPDISLQHLMAIMLLDGKLTFASSHDMARMKDPKVLAFRKRIEAIGDPSLADKQRRWRGIIRIELKDGRTLEDQTMAAKGSFENPLTEQEENEKATDLIGPTLGKKRTAALLCALWKFDKLKNVGALRNLYSR